MPALAEYIKTEIINGIEYDMSPANTNHIRIQRRLSRIIDNFLRGKKCEVFTEIGVTLDENNYVIPDLLVVCDPQKVTEQGISGAPDFVVEVLSISSKKKDRATKKDTYERFGVKEYWIIDPKAESIEVYILRNGKYELDGVYHNLDESEIDFKHMNESEIAEIKLSLKISLYDDLEIQTKDIFEG